MTAPSKMAGGKMIIIERFYYQLCFLCLMLKGVLRSKKRLCKVLTNFCQFDPYSVSQFCSKPLTIPAALCLSTKKLIRVEDSCPVVKLLSKDILHF